MTNLITKIPSHSSVPLSKASQSRINVTATVNCCSRYYLVGIHFVLFELRGKTTIKLNNSTICMRNGEQTIRSGVRVVESYLQLHPRLTFMIPFIVNNIHYTEMHDFCHGNSSRVRNLCRFFPFEMD